MKTEIARTGTLGWWIANGHPPEPGIDALERALRRVGAPLAIVETESGLAVGRGGVSTFGGDPSDPLALGIRAFVPAVRPE